MFPALAGLVAIVPGGVASVTGFGIGSVLTPLVGMQLGMNLAVAVVAIPHFAATFLRAWRLLREVDRGVFFRFGIASAVGGLAGVFLHGKVASAGLIVVFGALLVLAGIMGVTGPAERVRFGRRTAWLASALSGGFGGLVGNQGGVRSAGLLGSM